MILLIIACSLIGSVLLIGVCAPLSAVIPPTPPRDNTTSIVMEEPLQNDGVFNTKCEWMMSGESTAVNNGSGTGFDESSGEDTVKGDLRKWIASSSVPILRSRGMTDEEIKSELMRDFALTEEQVDEILATQ